MGACPFINHEYILDEFEVYFVHKVLWASNPKLRSDPDMRICFIMSLLHKITI